MAAEVEPSFANAYFNLSLVHAINNDFNAAVAALSKYRQLVPEPEGRIAEELLESLKKSLSAGKGRRLGSA